MSVRPIFSPCFRVFVVLAGAVSSLLAGDKIFLNSGETIECTILEETADGVKVEYHRTKSIIDEKIIPLSSIAKIIRATPDQLAYERLSEKFPTRDLMSVEAYEDLINNHIKTFLANFPESAYAPPVEELLEKIEDERNRVGAGHLKLDGEWITPTEYKYKKYNIDARMAHIDLRRQLTMGQYQKGLTSFLELEKESEGTLAYPEAIVTALKGMDNYERRLDQMIKKQPFLQAEREKGLNRQSESSRNRVERAIEEEIAEHKADREAEKEAGQIWKSIYAYDLEGLEEEKETIAKERERLAAKDLEVLRISAGHTAKALEHFAKKEYLKATAEISKAAASGADEHFIEKLKTKIKTMREDTEESVENAKEVNTTAEEGLDTVMRSRLEVPTDESGKSEFQLKREAAKKEAEAKEAAKAEAKKQETQAKAKEKADALVAAKAAETAKATAAAAKEAKNPETDADKPAAATSGGGGGSGLMSKLPFVLGPLLIILIAVAVKSRKGGDDEDEAGG